MSSAKDRLKGTLNRGPAVSAQSKLIPTLTHEDNINPNNAVDSDGKSTNNNNHDNNNINAIDNIIDNNESSKLKVLNDKYELLSKEREDLQNEAQVLIEELNKYKSENELLTQRLAQSEKSSKKLESQINAISSERDSAFAELETLRRQLNATDNEDVSAIIVEFAKARFMKQLGQKKGDTYKQDGFYHDNDIRERLDKFLEGQEKTKFDKSTVINAAIDNLLTRIGF